MFGRPLVSGVKSNSFSDGSMSSSGPSVRRPRSVKRFLVFAGLSLAVVFVLSSLLSFPVQLVVSAFQVYSNDQPVVSAQVVETHFDGLGTCQVSLSYVYADVERFSVLEYHVSSGRSDWNDAHQCEGLAGSIQDVFVDPASPESVSFKNVFMRAKSLEESVFVVVLLSVVAAVGLMGIFRFWRRY